MIFSARRIQYVQPGFSRFSLHLQVVSRTAMFVQTPTLVRPARLNLLATHVNVRRTDLSNTTGRIQSCFWCTTLKHPVHSLILPLPYMVMLWDFYGKLHDFSEPLNVPVKNPVKWPHMVGGAIVHGGRGGGGESAFYTRPGY